LAPGAKLELVRLSTSSTSTAPAMVDIALQLDDGRRVTGKFSTTVSLWEILLDFEKSAKVYESHL